MHPVLLALLVIYLVLTLLAILHNKPNWKYYKRLYNQLPAQYWYKENGVHYSSSPYLYDYTQMEWWPIQQDIKLRDGVWLFSSAETLLCPYSLYWYLKYRKWFTTKLK